MSMGSVLFMVLLIWNFTGELNALNDEGYALLALKLSISRDPDGSLSNWNSENQNPCSWNGVTCDDQKLVVSLSIPKKKLVGHLPSSLGLLSNLRHLNLRSNELTGSLPAELFRAQRLQSLVLYGNSFSGSIPNAIGDLKLLQNLDLSYNSLNGSIPESILQCKRLTNFDFSHNNLTGTVPSGFGHALASLQKLDLSFNNLNGLIPDDLGNLTRLQGTLDLSHNSFSGSIPASLGTLPEKVYVDLAYNNLSGPIPQTGALFNRGPTAFLGNPKLCGPPLKDPCLSNTESSPASHPFIPENHNNDEGGSKKGRGLSKTALVAIVVSDAIGICIVGFLFSCCYLKICSRRNRDGEGYVSEKEGKEKKGSSSCFKRDGSETPSSENQEPQHDLVLLDKLMVLNLDELLKASAFVLGKGGNGIVYKVVLEDGLIVAVRRLGEGGSQRCKEFQTEVEAIGKLRHQNIVELKAYYWSVEEKLLIYDYIPNGSLANALHGNPGVVSLKPLNWQVRLKIMRGIARGLVYLHEVSPKKYVHGSLKLSNILLGQDMEPHISDFGLMHLSSIAGSLESITTDQPSNKSSSSIGPPPTNMSLFYQAPEVMKATVKPSQKWDVYSFGVILLEMVTGRLPIVFVGKSEMEIVKWIQMCIDEKKDMSDILDPCLVPYDKEIEEEVIVVLKIAMACVSVSPEKRPPMKHIADSLNQIFLQ